MDTEFPPPRPITLEITSDIEPVKCSGTYRVTVGGFILAFDMGEDKYTVDHAAERTVFCCAGKNQSYTLTLADEETRMRLDTVFGAVEYAVRTCASEAEYSDAGLRMNLNYTLLSGGEVAAERSIILRGIF